MDKLSIREAARRFEVSRPTLVTWLKKGKISGDPQPGGGWLIDPSELIRAGVKARPGEVEALVKSPDPEPVNLTRFAGGVPVNIDAEVAALRAELEQERILRASAESLAAERAQHIEDLRRMLPPPDAKPRRRWWPW